MEKKKICMSGAQKRKIKKQKEEILKKHTKLDGFVNFISRAENAENNQASTSCIQTITQDINTIDLQNKNLSDEQDKDDTNVVKQGCASLSCDLGNYVMKNISDDEKRLLIMNYHKPKGPFPRDAKQNNRSFSEVYYSMTTKYGPVPRLWLCYSSILDAAYCHPCFLFSNVSSQWRTGLRDWANLTQRMKTHSSSQEHINACAVLELWKANKIIDRVAEEETRSKANFWRKVLERLFRITIMLSKNSLAFRGHREGFTEDYNGNFLSLVQLLATYDPIMKQILDMPSGSTRYLSPTIQNELIQCLGQKLLKELACKINSAPFYSLMLDTTQDIVKKDQLSIIIRYVHIIRDDNLRPIHFEINETFLGFFELEDHSAEGMKNQLLKILKEVNISIEKCYGQGYDGASLMSGAYNGLQTKLKEIQAYAEYVHCNSHNLNLIVNDSVNSCHEVSSFYTILQNIYTFFGNSVKRWDLLSKFTGESEVTLKKLNPTRWSGRLASITAVKSRFVDILKALTEIGLKSNKKEEREEAIQIKKKMEKFDFVFLCFFLHKVMCQINYASKTLQNINIDLNEATTVLQHVSEHLKEFRSSYDGVKLEAQNFAQQYGINTTFESKRLRMSKRHFDELVSDYRFENREHQFKVNVYYYVLDTIFSQINQRFTGMRTITNLFDFLEPKTIIQLPENEILKKCDNLSKKYCKIISDQFSHQYMQVISLLKKDLTPLMSIKQFSNLLLSKYGGLETEFSEVYVVLMLFLTLPVTVASVERTFSKLKIIKEYKRNSIGQSRLRDLAILCIEHKEAAKMEIKDLINDFASAKARKKQF